MRRGRQRGVSLAEALVVLGLLGITVVALAPFESMLLRSLRDDTPIDRPAALSWPARRLAADARTATNARVVSPTEARFTLDDGRVVTWTGAADALVRSDGANRERFAGRALTVEKRGALLDATLTERDGSRHRVEIFLRHDGGDR